MLLNPKLNKLILDIYSQAKEIETIYVGTEHLLLVILKLEGEPFVKDLHKNNVTYKLMSDIVIRLTATPFTFFKKTRTCSFNRK